MKYSLDRLLTESGDIVFVCPLEEFSFHSKPEPKILRLSQFRQSFILPPKLIDKFLDNSVGAVFKQNIGMIEELTFNELPILVLSGKDILKNDGPTESIMTLGSFVANFLHQLWIEKDHAVNVYMSYRVEQQTDNRIYTHKNIDRYWYTNRDGKDDEPTSFSHKEITSAVDRLNQAENFNDLTPHSEQTLRISGISRAVLFTLWLDDARQASDLLMKVSKYISALESLLLTSPAEVSHQLSERVALFLPPSKTIDARQTFSDMKKCYKFRSRALHGDTIKTQDTLKLSEMTEFLDNICRTFSRELVTGGPIKEILEKKPEEIEAIVLDKIFQRK